MPGQKYDENIKYETKIIKIFYMRHMNQNYWFYGLFSCNDQTQSANETEMAK